MKASRIGTVLITVFGCLAAPFGSHAAEPIKSYSSLEQAVEAGALDSRVFKTYNSGKTVRAILTLRHTPLAVKYDKYVYPAATEWQALQQFKATLAKSKAQFREQFPMLETIRNYEEFPLLYTAFDKRADLLAMLNSGWLLGVAADGVNELFSGANLSVMGALTSASWGETGAGVGIAIIDSGVNFTRGEFGSCTDVGPACKVRFARDFAVDDGLNDGSPVAHGTNVASIALQVAPGAHFVSLDAADPTDQLKDSDILNALAWVASNRIAFNIRAVNMSFGQKEYWTSNCTPGRNPYQSAFNTLRSVGVLPILASGNSATSGGTFTSGISFPACTPGAVSVGAIYDANIGMAVNASCTDAVTFANLPTCFAQSSPILSLWAPGHSITGGGMTLSGTSQATPHVSGALAILSALEPLAAASTLSTSLTTGGPAIIDIRNGVLTPNLNIAASLQARMPNPVNDAFAQAITLSGTRATSRQVSWSATKEAGEPNHATNGGGGSLWYRWTAPYSGTAVVDTVDSNYDTTLAVYVGNGVNSLAPVASNDDRMSGQTTSLVSFAAITGVEYRIAVDGRLNSGRVARGTSVVAINGVAANDNIAQAIPIALGYGMAGSNFGAAKQSGEPQHCGNQGGASVWYAFQSATTVDVRARTSGSSFGNRCVAVYDSQSPTAPTVTNLHLVAAAQWGYPDDPWSATFTAQAGVIYYIAVEGMSSEEPGFDAPARGQFTIDMSAI